MAKNLQDEPKYVVVVVPENIKNTMPECVKKKNQQNNLDLSKDTGAPAKFQQYQQQSMQLCVVAINPY